jgi:hypothetical protein
VNPAGSVTSTSTNAYAAIAPPSKSCAYWRKDEQESQRSEIGDPLGIKEKRPNTQYLPVLEFPDRNDRHLNMLTVLGDMPV